MASGNGRTDPFRVYDLFPTDADCRAHLEMIRWRGVPKCPYCEGTGSTRVPEGGRYHCNGCNTTFGVTVGTVFHHTHLPLTKWFAALSLLFDADAPISARQLAEELDINRNTAWYLSSRIGRAMVSPSQRPFLLRVIESVWGAIGSER